MENKNEERKHNEKLRKERKLKTDEKNIPPSPFLLTLPSPTPRMRSQVRCAAVMWLIASVRDYNRRGMIKKKAITSKQLHHLSITLLFFAPFPHTIHYFFLPIYFLLRLLIFSLSLSLSLSLSNFLSIYFFSPSFSLTLNLVLFFYPAYISSFSLSFWCSFHCLHHQTAKCRAGDT